MKRILSLFFIVCLSAALLSGCQPAAPQGEDTLLLAVGNADVPVGDYTQKIFDFYGIDEAAVASHLTYGSNAKEVTTAVAEGMADCGVLYQTDARSAGLTPTDFASPEMCGKIIYPASLLCNAPNAEAARHFAAYLQGEDAGEIFSSVGFTPLKFQNAAFDASADSGEIVVFAAASLQETLTEIGKAYAALAPNVKPIFTFDSSGTLKTQIEEGAVCDLFLSASPKQLNALSEQGLLAEETRFDLLENKVCLCVASNSACGITSFDELAVRLKEIAAK